MRTRLALALFSLAVACQQQETSSTTTATTTSERVVASDAANAKVDTVIQPLPVFLDRSLLGLQVGADGNVSAETATVDKGQPVYLTMFLRESPVGLSTRVVWLDMKKKEISKEERDMKGGKVVTFMLDTKKLNPGHYMAEGYWGGNLAAQKEFEVKAAAGSPKKK